MACAVFTLAMSFSVTAVPSAKCAVSITSVLNSLIKSTEYFERLDKFQIVKSALIGAARESALGLPSGLTHNNPLEII